MDSTRRRFLQTAAAFATVLSWQPRADSFGQSSPAAARKKPRQAPRFHSIRLQSARLDELRRFYTKTLGIPLLGEDERRISLAFGKTTIHFDEAAQGDDPFYHFAFNIPENKFAEAKAWLRDRCPLLKDNRSGADELYFRDWDAHAVYFEDPGGNIAELIARHTLPNASEGAFTPSDLLYVSEIGLVSPEPNQLVAGLGEAFGLKPT